jgi:hypothetical protein
VRVHSVPKAGGPLVPIAETLGLAVGFAGATADLLIWEPSGGGVAGRTSTVYSCNPTNCAATLVPWFSTHNGVVTCDVAAQKCFAQNELSTSVMYATAAAPQSLLSFAPDLQMPLGALETADGYLYGVGGESVQNHYVLERVLEDTSISKVRLADGSVPRAGGTAVSIAGPIRVTTDSVFVIAPTTLPAGTFSSMYSTALPQGAGNQAPLGFNGSPLAYSNAYWADDVGVVWIDTSRGLVTCPVSGCGPAGPETLATVSSDFVDLTADAQAVYWITSDTGPQQLMKVAR